MTWYNYIGGIGWRDARPVIVVSGPNRGRYMRVWGDITRRGRNLALAITLAAALIAPRLYGQKPAEKPTEAATRAPASDTTKRPAAISPNSPTDKRAEPTKPLPATVIEVVGNVEWALHGVDVLASEGWRPVLVNQRLIPGTQVRTGLRSHVNLQFGETTVCSLRSATHASIDDLYRSTEAEVVRIGLGYGAIRGGSSEGTIRADVVIDSTVATLAKRGTEGWEIAVEPGTGRFNISLAQYGLVEAVQKLGARRVSRSVRPGEYATERNIANMWVRQDIFDRSVQFFDVDSVTAAEADSLADNRRGYGIMAPSADASVVDASGRVDAQWVVGQIDARVPPSIRPPATILIPRGPIARPEGNFGTGDVFRVPSASSITGRRR